MFCPECGKKISKTAKFCSGCGKNLKEKDEDVKEKKPKKNKKNIFNKIWKWFLKLSLKFKGLLGILFILLITFVLFLIFKVNIILWIISLVVFGVVIFLNFWLPKLNIIKIIGLFIILVISSVMIIIFNKPHSKNNNAKDNVKDTTKDTNYIDSSVVSKGVNIDDLGNIVNGQFYFVEDNLAFYSTFDLNGECHVYKMDLSTNNVQKIFDGFGWSFVVNEGWLYFSGNPGTKIDATYKLYRVKIDGTNIQLLNSNYTYNMHFYKGYIYYMRQENQDSDIAHIYKANLDGANETKILSDVGYQSIIYENSLYYIDTEGYLYRSDVDGKNSYKIYGDVVKQFIIGQGKIIYLDSSNNIKTCNPDGTNVNVIRLSDGTTISRINSYKTTIFYSKYGDYVTDRYAYDYSIYSINIDGTNDKFIYSGVSAGIWNNIIDGKLYVLDYAQDFTTNKYIAITRSMNLDGTNLLDLNRQ